MNFGTLAAGLGSFPLGDETHLTPPDCRGYGIGIRSLVGFSNLDGP